MAEGVTQLIARIHDGDRAAESALVEQLYQELHGIAARAMRGERQNHTLQTTALANEALIRLLGDRAHYHDKLHFLRLCATTMRRVLVDHARARRADKRGGDAQDVTLHDSRVLDDSQDREFAFLALDAAIERLQAEDPRKAKIMELRFFAGLDVAEIASALDLSEATVRRDVRFSRAWLKRELDSS